MPKPPNNSTDLSNESNMAIGCEPSKLCCNIEIPCGAANVSKYSVTLGFQKASLLIVNGYVNGISLLVIFMLSEPIKLIFVNKIYTSVLIYVFKTNGGNSLPIAYISVLL